CLYISPLKSLANDIHRNLEQPLERIHAEYASRGIDVTPPRHAIRHGDTPQTVRNEMRNTTPHILNTTPETLAILLNAPSFREKLRSVEYVIVDEIHALADSKRGTHLAVSLERLEELTKQSFTRIGCSATIEPLDRIASFLAGYEEGSQRPINIIDTRFTRDYDLHLKCPVPDLMETNPDTIREAFYTELVDLIRSHTTTLVFTNSRSGAERVLTTLREQYGFDESSAACHHGSLSPEQRQPVEEGLKNGTFDVVTTSTSLELGIDMHAVDLVVQVGSPKSISSFLQRVGRAGHKPGETVKGRLFALDWDELVECTVLLDAAKRQRIDTISPPRCAHDVAAQHVYGMAINAIWNEDAMYAVLTRAYPYQEYSREDWELLMQYLTGAKEDLQRFNIYPKIWRDTNDTPAGDHHYPDFTVGEPLIGSRG
ncbi:MAG: helicase-related protein, partial [Halobacteriaceae archaeon]